MIDLNNYISEKLKINKNIKLITSFEEDDKIICISIDVRFEALQVKIYYPFTVIEFSKTKIKYKSTADKIIEHNIFLNSNNYYEIDTGRKFRAIILSISQAVDVLNQVEKNPDKELSKDMLIDLFDEEDRDIIEKYEIDKRYSQDDVKKILDYIQTNNYITEKLRINKDTELSNSDFDTKVKDLSKLIFEKLSSSQYSKWIMGVNVNNSNKSLIVILNSKTDKNTCSSICGYIRWIIDAEGIYNTCHDDTINLNMDARVIDIDYLYLIK